MKTKKCKHHGVAITDGTQFCSKCHEDLDKVSDKLNNFFSKITIDFGKDGPVVRRIK